MYFHMVYSSEWFSDSSWKKSMRNVLWKLKLKATKLMVITDDEFVANPTSPPTTLFHAPFTRAYHLNLLWGSVSQG